MLSRDSDLPADASGLHVQSARVPAIHPTTSAAARTAVARSAAAAAYSALLYNV